MRTDFVRIQNWLIRVDDIVAIEEIPIDAHEYIPDFRGGAHIYFPGFGNESINVSAALWPELKAKLNIGA